MLPSYNLVIDPFPLYSIIFSKYFNDCPVVYVSGRTFRIELHDIEGVNRLVAQGQSMQSKNQNAKVIKGSKNAKKKPIRGDDDSLPMKFDADLTAELIIRIITVYSSKNENNNNIRDATGTGTTSTKGGNNTNNDLSNRGDAILVFLSGVQAIDSVNRALRQRSIVQSMKVQV